MLRSARKAAGLAVVLAVALTGSALAAVSFGGENSVPKNYGWSYSNSLEFNGHARHGRVPGPPGPRLRRRVAAGALLHEEPERVEQLDQPEEALGRRSRREPEHRDRGQHAGRRVDDPAELPDRQRGASEGAGPGQHGQRRHVGGDEVALLGHRPRGLPDRRRRDDLDRRREPLRDLDRLRHREGPLPHADERRRLEQPDHAGVDDRGRERRLRVLRLRQHRRHRGPRHDRVDRGQQRRREDPFDQPERDARGRRHGGELERTGER